MSGVRTRVHVSDDLVLDEREDDGQLAQLSLGVHLAQRRADEVVVEAVERQEVTSVRVRPARRGPASHTQLAVLAFHRFPGRQSRVCAVAQYAVLELRPPRELTCKIWLESILPLRTCACVKKTRFCVDFFINISICLSVRFFVGLQVTVLG